MFYNFQISDFKHLNPTTNKQTKLIQCQNLETKSKSARTHTHTEGSRTDNLQPRRKPTFLLLLPHQSNPSRLTHIQSNNSAPAKSLLSLRRRRRKEIRSYLNNRRWKWNSSDLPHGFSLLLTRTPTSLSAAPPLM